jgi:hypothetical protein
VETRKQVSFARLARAIIPMSSEKLRPISRWDAPAAFHHLAAT